MTFRSQANVLASCWIYRSTKEFRNIPYHFQAHLVFLVLAKDRVNFTQPGVMCACPCCFSIPCTSSLRGGSKESSLPRRRGMACGWEEKVAHGGCAGHFVLCLGVVPH